MKKTIIENNQLDIVVEYIHKISVNRKMFMKKK